MSRLIETIRMTDGIVQNRPYHTARIIESCQRAFGARPNWLPDEVLKDHTASITGIWKRRVAYDQFGFNVENHPYTIRPVRSLKAVGDDAIEYSLKWEDRTQLNNLFSKRAECDDVLIIKNGLVTDTSYSNVAFRKGTEWFTPDSFLLNGTMRKSLIDRGILRVATISRRDISSFSEFRLINSMIGWDGETSDVSNIH